MIELGEAVKAIRAHLDVIDSHTVNSGAAPLGVAAINGPGSWAANPWVWVVSFRKLA